MGPRLTSRPAVERRKDDDDVVDGRPIRLAVRPRKQLLIGYRRARLEQQIEQQKGFETFFARELGKGKAMEKTLRS